MLEKLKNKSKLSNIREQKCKQRLERLAKQLKSNIAKRKKRLINN